MNKNQAILSSKEDFTSFTYDNHVIRFRTSPHLERYTKVKEWDNGYLVVMAKYSNNEDDIEEYIDLIPILQNLYFDTKSFLNSIEGGIYSMIDILNVADDADVIINSYAFKRKGNGVSVLIMVKRAALLM